jgi:nitrate reductase alpha subunit
MVGKSRYDTREICGGYQSQERDIDPASAGVDEDCRKAVLFLFNKGGYEMVTQASVLINPSVAVEVPQAKIRGRIISTKVVGVSFGLCQEAIARLHIGDRVWLEPEPDNVYDRNAIMVTRNNGEQIGYINRHLAQNLAPYFEITAGPVRGRVKYLTGSSFDGYSLGVVIQFKIPRFIDTSRNHKKHQMGWED